MNDTLILVGYSLAMILGFAGAATIIYYSFTRNTKYQKSIRPIVQTTIEDDTTSPSLDHND